MSEAKGLFDDTLADLKEIERRLDRLPTKAEWWSMMAWAFAATTVGALFGTYVVAAAVYWLLTVFAG